MLNFSDICTYSNKWDLIWSSLVFPSEIPNAKFVDGWVRIPRTEPHGSSVSYNIEQVLALGGAATGDPTTYTTDWRKSGTAVVTADNYIEPLDAQAYRDATAARFNSHQTGLHMYANVGVKDASDHTYIENAYFQLRIGADNYTVSNLAASTNCIDTPIVITWTISAQTTHAIEVVNEQGSVVYQATQNIATPSHTIPAGTLPPGIYSVRVQSGYDMSAGLRNAGVGLMTPIQTIPLTLWRIEPKIIAFEPDGVAQNREQPIAVTWNSENQQSYVLKVKQGGVAVTEFSGTTGKTDTIPANTLASGTTELELTLKYIPTWGTEANAVYASETINFQAYGTPPLPVLTTPDTVDTAFPQVTWTSSEQYSFRLKVLSGTTVLQDTGEVPSELKAYTLTAPLENGSYTLKLTIKNQYGIYSPEATKALTVSYVLPQKPDVYCAGNDANGSISVRVTNTDMGNFAHCDLLRKLDGEWIRVVKDQPASFEYIDYLVKPDATYQYMARAIGLTAGYQNSDVKTAKASIVSTQLFEPDKPTDSIDLRLEPGREETAHRGVHFMTYAGQQAPVVEFGEELFSSVAASFFVRTVDGERLKQLYNTATILCYRDSRGRFLYGFISSGPVIKDAEYGWCAVKFDFTQTHYVEGV